MADWIENEIWVTGDRGRLNDFQARADERFAPASERDPYNGDIPSVFSFHRLLPMPADVIARGYDPPGGGYDWQKANWGVKWGPREAVLHEASLAELGDCLLYAFDTAWEPPHLFLRKVSKLYPELTFEIKSSYPDNGWLEEAAFRDGLEDNERDEEHVEE